MNRNKTDLYMNPITGSVDTWENWECDQELAGFPGSDLDILVRVEKDQDGNWIESGEDNE